MNSLSLSLKKIKCKVAYTQHGRRNIETPHTQRSFHFIPKQNRKQRKKSQPPNFPQPFSLFFNGPAQLDQNLCSCKVKQKRKQRKFGERERERSKGEREDRCLQMSSNQTHLLSNKNNVGSQMPFCNPPKNPIFINTVSTSALSLPQKKYPFLFFPHLFLFPHNRIMWALLGFLSWSEFSQRKQGRREPSHFPLPLSLFLVSLLLYCFVLLPCLSLLHYFNRTHLSGLSFQLCLLPFVASVLDL